MTQTIDSGVDDKLKELKDSLERKDYTFDALFRLFEKLGNTLDLTVIIRLFLMTIVGQLGVSQIVCYLRSNQAEDFNICHSLGIGLKALPETLERRSVISQRLSRSGGLLIIGDSPDSVTGSVDMSSPCEMLKLNGFGYAHPITDGGDLMGMIFFNEKIDGSSFSEFNIEILHMIVEVASMSIRNAVLYQEALESKMELEDFAKVKKQFLMHTSHEFRTPLTILRSSIWSIEADEEGDDVLVELAKKAVNRLEEVIEQIHSLNEIGLRESSLTRDYCDVPALLEQCLMERAHDLGEKGVTFRIDKKVKSDLRIDPMKMKIVFKSLINNAISSVESGGSIGLTAEFMEKNPTIEDGVDITGREKDEAIKDNGRFLVLRIRDDGVGIPVDEIKLISEPFRRASNSTVKEVKGLGLGLSVAKEIVSAHKGYLICRSTPSEGAEFSVWLPLD